MMKNNNLSTFNTTEPFQFNPWKHHFFFILGEINSIKDTHQINKLNRTIICIGNSLTDLYFGSLSVSRIFSEIKSGLQSTNRFNHRDFTSWINDSDKHYREIQLPDGSIWVLRISDNKNNYIHIHPGKYSQHTLRIRSLTLKTAILTAAESKLRGTPVSDLSLINYIRNKYLYESPLKIVSTTCGLGKMISMFNNYLK